MNEYFADRLEKHLKEDRFALFFARKKPGSTVESFASLLELIDTNNSIKEKKINDLLAQYLAQFFIAIRENINSSLLSSICRQLDYTVLAGYYNEQLDTVLAILNKDQLNAMTSRMYSYNLRKSFRKPWMPPFELFASITSISFLNRFGRGDYSPAACTKLF